MDRLRKKVYFLQSISHCDALQKLHKVYVTHLVQTERFKVTVCKIISLNCTVSYNRKIYKYLQRILLRGLFSFINQKKLFYESFFC